MCICPYECWQCAAVTVTSLASAVRAGGGELQRDRVQPPSCSAASSPFPFLPATPEPSSPSSSPQPPPPSPSSSLLPPSYCRHKSFISTLMSMLSPSLSYPPCGCVARATPVPHPQQALSSPTHVPPHQTIASALMATSSELCSGLTVCVCVCVSLFHTAVNVKWGKKKLQGLELDATETPAVFKSQLYSVTGRDTDTHTHTHTHMLCCTCL